MSSRLNLLNSCEYRPILFYRVRIFFPRIYAVNLCCSDCRVNVFFFGWKGQNCRIYFISDHSKQDFFHFALHLAWNKGQHATLPSDCLLYSLYWLHCLVKQQQNVQLHQIVNSRRQTQTQRLQAWRAGNCSQIETCHLVQAIESHNLFGQFNGHHKEWGGKRNITSANWRPADEAQRVFNIKYYGIFCFARWTQEHNPDLSLCEPTWMLCLSEHLAMAFYIVSKADYLPCWERDPCGGSDKNAKVEPVTSGVGLI